jgi:hypothetical protein
MSTTRTTLHRVQARSGRQQIPVAAASQLLFHSDLPHLSPEQMLWVRVLLQLRDDIATGHGLGTTARQTATTTATGMATSTAVGARQGYPDPSARVLLTQEDKMRLDFVAVALGLPGDTLPRLVEAAEEEFRERERARIQRARGEGYV